MPLARPRRSLASLALCFVAGGCAGGVGPVIVAPAEPPPGEGVPGFDTREYPGDPAMARWRANSPYRWVGYYLPAPCYTGTSWLGKRPPLARMGWGMAVLFVGEQDWAAGAVPPAEGAPPRCTRSNLSEERGRADGRAAAAAAAAEGFGRGTSVYLDVERVDAVSQDLRDYVAAWTRALVEDGRFLPAVYVHARNARDIHGVMSAAAGTSPRLWVAGGSGFDLRQAPTASGFEEASAWQGDFNVDETWGDVRLRIDRNVATSRDPSG